MSNRLATLCLTLLAAAPLMADDAVEPRYRIAVEVTEVDENLRERVAGYLATELQALDDVEVTSENPDYKLYAMVMQVRTSDGKRMAYVLGTSVVTFFPDGYFDTILSSKLKNGREVNRRLQDVTVYKNQFMSLAGPSEENLQDIAKNVVAKFDVWILGPERSKAAGTINSADSGAPTSQ